MGGDDRDNGIRMNRRVHLLLIISEGHCNDAILRTIKHNVIPTTMTLDFSINSILSYSFEIPYNG